jgi:hypothetical protein
MRIHFAALSAAVVMFVAVQPAAAQKVAVQCNDGTTSAVSGRGACSHHGGVNAQATKVVRKEVHQEVKEARKEVRETGGVVAVRCSDGTTSVAAGRGACSHHGGVAAAAAAPAPAPLPPAAPARVDTRVIPPRPAVVGSGLREDNNPAGALAQCRDGMYSHAQHRSGACSRHGGVSRWM